MTITDLSDYLQIPESKIRSFIKNRRIPFHDNHGFLRFNKNGIDEWMKTPTSELTLKVGKDVAYAEDKEVSEKNMEIAGQISYREKPINEYVLTATIIFISVSAWTRIPDFIIKTIRAINETKLREHGRNYLYREEFKPFINNFNDYLRICCQLGLIDNKQGNGRRKHYYPTKYAEQIYQEPHQAKKIILDSILYIVRNKLETFPHERHSILLLWYLLALKEKGLEPEEQHFKLDKDKTNNYFPLIRLNFTKSLCHFLFDNDIKKEQQFLTEWKKLV